MKMPTLGSCYANAVASIPTFVLMLVPALFLFPCGPFLFSLLLLPMLVTDKGTKLSLERDHANARKCRTALVTNVGKVFR